MVNDISPGLKSAAGYIVARLFTSIFELAVDTTLQCFLCCEESGFKFRWCRWGGFSWYISKNNNEVLEYPLS